MNKKRILHSSLIATVVAALTLAFVMQSRPRDMAVTSPDSTIRKERHVDATKTTRKERPSGKHDITTTRNIREDKYRKPPDYRGIRQPRDHGRRIIKNKNVPVM